MLRPHGGGTGIELSSFVRPRSRAPIARGDGNELGLRSVVFEVDDLQAAVDGLAAGGYGLVGGIGQHENIWRMAYVRGPEGIIVSLTERIDGRRVAARYPCDAPIVRQAAAAPFSRRR
jgi:hypothetical protein